MYSLAIVKENQKVHFETLKHKVFFLLPKSSLITTRLSIISFVLPFTLKLQALLNWWCRHGQGLIALRYGSAKKRSFEPSYIIFLLCRVLGLVSVDRRPLLDVILRRPNTAKKSRNLRTLFDIRQNNSNEPNKFW